MRFIRGGGSSLRISGGRAVFETICLEEAAQYHRPSGSHKKFRPTQPLGRQVLKVLVEYFTQPVRASKSAARILPVVFCPKKTQPFHLGPEKSPGLDTALICFMNDNLRCGVESLLALSLSQSSGTFVLSLRSSHGILISKRCLQTTKRKRNCCAAWARRSETFV